MIQPALMSAKRQVQNFRRQLLTFPPLADPLKIPAPFLRRKDHSPKFPLRNRLRFPAGVANHSDLVREFVWHR